MNIKVKHNIGDIVEHEFNENKFKIVGYNYIKGRGVQYICLQEKEDDYLYMDEISLKKGKISTIGFKL